MRERGTAARRRQQFDREFPVFSHIEAMAANFDRLIHDGKTVHCIANLGCATGMETLGLMRAFGAVVGVGVDVDGDGILQAAQTLEGLKSAAIGVAHRAAYRGGEYQRWWRELVPDFIKGLVLNRIPESLARGITRTSVSFIQADITKPPCLAPDRLDLAYCDHVLYHVYCDRGERELQCAANGMAELVAPGGWVVAVEPLSCSPECAEVVDLAEFFERAGLRPYQAALDPLRPEGRARTYSYEKPAASAA